MPGQYSTQGPVIDASIAMIRNLALTETITSTTPTPVTVFDGPPGGANIPQVFIAIGGQDTNDPIPDGNEDWSYLGAMGRYERYDIVGHVYAFVGGDDNLGQTGPSDAQATARAQVTAIMQAIEAGYLADVSLSNENGGDQLVIWAYVQRVKLQQTTANDSEASKGRWCQADFTVNVYNTLTVP